MAAQGRGGGKTPERLVQFMRKAVEKSSQSAVARETGLTQSAVGRYIKGIGEPSQATLEKLAAYFGVTVAWLRGEEYSPDIIALAARIGTDAETAHKYLEEFCLDENMESQQKENFLQAKIEQAKETAMKENWSGNELLFVKSLINKFIDSIYYCELHKYSNVEITRKGIQFSILTPDSICQNSNNDTLKPQKPDSE